MATQAGRTLPADHKHLWRVAAHFDFCHHYRWTYSCECGATAVRNDERDPTADPYSRIWMDPDTNSGEFCDRCEQILDGDEITSSILIQSADGTIEQQEMRVRAQGKLEE